MDKTISVERLVRVFKLKVLTEADYLDREVTRANARRPGLEFTKFMDYFPKGHVFVLGENEIHYLKSLPEEERDEQVATLVKYGPPSIIVTDGRDDLEYLPKYCKRHHIPLLVTEDTNYEFIRKIDNFLIKELAPEIAIHGVCVNVFGIGVLVRGASGVGKSETAHSLVGRGHRLVADDIVVLKKLSPRTLLGTHNGTNKELLSLRSIGLLNVVRMYGRSAFQDESRIALDIELTKWKEDELYNDLEVETKFTEYMDVKIPSIEIQLKPGRDVVGLIEAAVNNWYLKQQGYSAKDEFIKRIEEEIDAE
ncbi:MAG TPA: HPr(Ser) kinase/phosphatase [Candidatus Pseudogracilibacillus intestinigallinarum]|uniref:HPr(Ser) kinase/phosphatase n=1 Tax=Candidatus Pseudogracilibacillus intestinigallinarum TaxID=2838742 RepID=A0A9D1PLD8_9BACI|nr:HPr(Ser) kinase/phosphatase [Candidatus Pseudogracilibacillus intestinigallinarum]